MLGANGCCESTEHVALWHLLGTSQWGLALLCFIGIWMQAVATLTGLPTLRDYCQLGELRFIASHESSHFSGQAEVAVCTVSKKSLPLVTEVRIGVIRSRYCLRNSMNGIPASKNDWWPVCT